MNNQNTFANPNPADSSQHQADQSVNILELLYRLVDKIALILAAGLIGALLMGIVAGGTSTVMYSATAKLYLVGGNDSGSIQAANSLVSDYLAVFSTKELQQRVVDRLVLPYSADALNSMVFPSNPAGTHIIEITVMARTGEEAMSIANAYAELSGDVMMQKLNVARPQIFESATSAVPVSSGNTSQARVMGAMAGVFLVCAVVVLQGVFDDRIRIPEDMEREFGVQTLGVLTAQIRMPSPQFGRKPQPEPERDYPGRALAEQVKKTLAEQVKKSSADKKNAKPGERKNTADRRSAAERKAAAERRIAEREKAAASRNEGGKNE